jgi:hypothetical protein
MSTHGSFGFGSLAVLGLVAVAGCSTLTVGRDFNYGAFEGKAKQGVTTSAEVREWLGAPAALGVALESNGERNDEWTYYHGSGKLPSGKDVSFKMLQIKFRPDGTLYSYTWSGETKTAAPAPKL